MMTIVRSIFRAEEVKEHPFFKDIDWKQVYLLKLTPPLIPPRGEVNAADAFDIGNFDEDDTKGIKVNINRFSNNKKKTHHRLFFSFD